MAATLSSVPAAAATIAVNETEDELNTDNDCSLREAIRAANTNLQVDQCPAGSPAATDDITVPAGDYTLSVTVSGENAAATGDLDVGGMTTIEGAGIGTTTIDANGIDRVLHVLSGGTVAVSDLTLTGGDVSEEGGGVLNQGTLLTLTDVAVTENTSSTLAGGIKNQGPLEIFGGSVSANTGGTGIAGIYNEDSDLTIIGSELSDNVGTGGTGGGLLNFGEALIEDTTIDNNDGLPQINHPTGLDRTMTIRNSTITGGNAGAIDNNGPMIIENTTISGNSGGAGAGIQTSSDNAPVSIVNSTITSNTSGSGGVTCCNGGGGISHAAGSQVTLRNTIIAGNEHGPDPDGPHPDCFQQASLGPVDMISEGGNLIGEIDGCTFAPQTTDQVGNDADPAEPMLGVLADNGGPTETHALLPASPAIDVGVGCPPPVTDQREVPRPQGPGCDAGAFETTPPSSAIAFPGNGTHYQSPAFAVGCGDPAPNACGSATENPDGAALDFVGVRIQRADGMFWDGDSWEPAETWNLAAGVASWSYGFDPAEGTHTVSSRATDVDGYVEATATATFTIDDTPPETSFTKKPKKKVKTSQPRKRARFGFESTESEASFACRLDRRAWKPCEPPFKARVDLGRHRLQVRATDSAGNTDPSPAAWRFRVIPV